MKKLLLSSLALAVPLLAFALSAPRFSVAEEKADAQTLFLEVHKCVMCHSVAAADIEAKTKSEKLKGPDMSGYQSDLSFEKLAAYQRKEVELNGAKHKKAFKGSDEELQAIIDWLGSLEAQE